MCTTAGASSRANHDCEYFIDMYMLVVIIDCTCAMDGGVPQKRNADLLQLPLPVDPHLECQCLQTAVSYVYRQPCTHVGTYDMLIHICTGFYEILSMSNSGTERGSKGISEGLGLHFSKLLKLA